MTNPYDLGRDVGGSLAQELLAEKLRLTEQPEKKRVVAVYAGRFQPFHKGHYSVYRHLVDKFGAENVFVGTSNKVDMPKSPFPFDEKQLIINRMFGIPAEVIRQVKSPYAPKEILDDFDSQTTSFVTAVSEKDAGRIGGKYYKEFPGDTADLEGHSTRGYFITVPELKMDVGGENISGTQIRSILGNPSVSPKAKAALFKKLYGKEDPDVMRLIVKRATEAERARSDIESEPKHVDTDTEKKQKEPGNLGDKTIANPETGRQIKVKSAMGYDPQHPARKNAEKELQDEAITIPVEVGDTILTGKFKNKKTVVKTIGTDEHGMPIINGRKVATFRIVKPTEEGKDMISRVAVESYRDRTTGRTLVTEGGSAGHMDHPFDDLELTFGDLKQIVEMGLSGNLSVEAPVTEKLDGQNISVSWKDGRGVIFSRNKGHFKDFGTNAMTVDGVKQMFAGRGDITDAFTLAARDLSSAIGKLSSKVRDEIFSQGSKWMSMEIIFPATQNVIPYGHNMLVFHNTIEVDEKGNAIGLGADAGKKLASTIKKINQDVQENFSFSGPIVVTLPKSDNFARRKGHFVGRITKLQNQFHLKDSDRIIMWHQRWWEDFIDEKAAAHKYGMPSHVRQGLLKRWAFSAAGDYAVPMMKRDIDHSKFLTWALTFDKQGKKEQFKKNIAPFEKIFLQLGAEILQNVRGLLSVSPGSAAEALRKELDGAVSDLKRANDVNQMKKVNAQLKKLKSIGLDKLIPTEGIVFMFRGKMYKFTGTFAPLNQILGALKFG